MGSSLPSTLNEFPQFKKLPPELRIKIWKFSRQQRIIKPIFMRFLKCKFDADIPAILHVCRESGVEGLKSYMLLYKEDSYVVSENPIYFDFKLDVLHFTGYHSRRHKEKFISRSAQGTLENIENLYMTDGCRDQFTPVTDRPWIFRFQSLAQLTLLLPLLEVRDPFKYQCSFNGNDLPKSFLESAEIITTKEKEQIHRNCGAWLLAVKYHVEELRIRRGKNVSPWTKEWNAPKEIRCLRFCNSCKTEVYEQSKIA